MPHQTTTSVVMLRPMCTEDRDFLTNLYVDIRAPEFTGLAWSGAQLRQFLALQFDAQDRHYRQQHPNASFQIICSNGKPIGRMILDTSGEVHRLVDITVSPSVQGCGIGTSLVEHAMRVAVAAACSLTLHVWKSNPARRWYARLGFREETEDDTYVLMRWNGVAPILRS